MEEVETLENVEGVVKQEIDWNSIKRLDRRDSTKKVIQCNGDVGYGIPGCGCLFEKFTPTLVEGVCPRCQAIYILGLTEEEWIRGVRKFELRAKGHIA
jgi:hypothetical protein